MSVSLARGNNAKIYLQWLLDAKQNFMLESSNYTTSIITATSKRKFVMNKQSARTFAAFQKIKADIVKKEIPKIESGSLIYFQHDFKKSVYIDTVINIDLRSAYATILYLDKYISAKTYEYLTGCNKQERLASVGMLASRKRIYQYKNGEPISMETKVSEFAGVFFYAIQKTYEIMSLLKQVAGNDYLFTWVDGIYILPNQQTAIKMMKVLQDYEFQFSTEILTEFDVSVKQRHIDITFMKSDKKKKFSLPLNQNEYAQSIRETIHTHKNYKHETSKIKNAFVTS